MEGYIYFFICFIMINGAVRQYIDGHININIGT
jgi:hypothetical protein